MRTIYKICILIGLAAMIAGATCVGFGLPMIGAACLVMGSGLTGFSIAFGTTDRSGSC